MQRHAGGEGHRMQREGLAHGALRVQDAERKLHRVGHQGHAAAGHLRRLKIEAYEAV